MKSFDNHRLLTRICAETPRVVCCDADLLLKVSDTEPAPPLIWAPLRSIICNLPRKLTVIQ